MGGGFGPGEGEGFGIGEGFGSGEGFGLCGNGGGLCRGGASAGGLPGGGILPRSTRGHTPWLPTNLSGVRSWSLCCARAEAAVADRSTRSRDASRAHLLGADTPIWVLLQLCPAAGSTPACTCVFLCVIRHQKKKTSRGACWDFERMHAQHLQTCVLGLLSGRSVCHWAAPPASIQ